MIRSRPTWAPPKRALMGQRPGSPLVRRLRGRLVDEHMHLAAVSVIESKLDNSSTIDPVACAVGVDERDIDWHAIAPCNEHLSRLFQGRGVGDDAVSSDDPRRPKATAPSGFEPDLSSRPIPCTDLCRFCQRLRHIVLALTSYVWTPAGSRGNRPDLQKRIAHRCQTYVPICASAATCDHALVAGYVLSGGCPLLRTPRVIAATTMMSPSVVTTRADAAPVIVVASSACVAISDPRTPSTRIGII